MKVNDHIPPINIYISRTKLVLLILDRRGGRLVQPDTMGFCICSFLPMTAFSKSAPAFRRCFRDDVHLHFLFTSI
jgi:hypothetical protein